MKKHIVLFTLTITSLLISSCGSDDSKTCITCNSEQTIEFLVCEESNGNASVNGENTGTQYALYLDGLVAAGADCGGD
ncbi:hypothetical protein ULMS_04480 [Patiriisocius marinistellae]|uniref:Uncharacterized protein n=1 Tax=Patiriisocius marinistellae TaxID=2494560 RepID=A0A5J4FTI4_9FLAO|nr:hypothetical protein [Patiriisocius marinistellae]GEQ84940.1 hypothetical protein ULMS_04480 [Patiriisocius marinistellae]